MGRRIAGTAVLAAMTLIGTGSATGFLLRPASAPQELTAATEVTAAPVGRERLADERTVKVSLRTMAAAPLVVGFAGRVTASACRPGTPLRSGRPVARINATPLIALATTTPLYRDLSRGDRGRDVRALQHELVRLGRSTATDGRYGWSTEQAVRKLQKASGVADPDGKIAHGKILWLPAASVTPQSCELVRGASVSAGSTVAKVAPQLTGVSVTSMPANLTAGARRIRLLGVTGALRDDGTAGDPAFLRKVAATREYRLIQASGKEPDLTATISLHKPVETVKIPPGALFAVDGDTGCVQSGATAYRVTIVGSRLGATLVTLREPAPASVALGSAVTATGC
ncbi:MAG TPA: peptidoglycan-binding domain-containing protein [Actinoplanes sp.]|nr:peptidoglycan-binding domain-containing protein [Actinoplanes sp.]